MKCAYCPLVFETGNHERDWLPGMPVLCSCNQVSVYLEGALHVVTPEEMVALKESPVWKEFIEPMMLQHVHRHRIRNWRWN